ncbi:hypothetical protein HanPSC8_Chr01g0000491 [Helianthus annuus]|nr:hypothetical protein HanPSC8_Chr01g0000491 [Helianthus annuus]
MQLTLGKSVIRAISNPSHWNYHSPTLVTHIIHHLLEELSPLIISQDPYHKKLQN